ncbi:hypothetical protein [Comamonas testosteroni]|nr:hypothetical protein [Comamonas testosteroni]
MNESMSANSREAPERSMDQARWPQMPQRKVSEGYTDILQAAAPQCKELAIKASWLEVQLQEIKKVVS